MHAEKVTLTAEKETLLLTLYGRAADARARTPILDDPTAQQVVDRIDYDWTRFRLSHAVMANFLVRAKRIDDRIRTFIADHQERTELRARLFPDREHYQSIGSSVTDPGWLAAVPDDRPTMVVAEGLLMYLAADLVPPLLRAMVDRFPSGELIFDAFSSTGVRLSNNGKVARKTGAVYGWGLDDPRELERWDPRLRFVERIGLTDAPELATVAPLYRLVYRLMTAVPATREMNRVLRYVFT